MKSVLNVAQLAGRQFIIKDDHSNFTPYLFFIKNKLSYLFQFAFSYIRCLIRSFRFLGEAFDRDNTSCLCKKLQLVQVFTSASLILHMSYQCYQYGCFRFSFRYDKFFHKYEWSIVFLFKRKTIPALLTLHHQVVTHKATIFHLYRYSLLQINGISHLALVQIPYI